jgi:outer membrane biosynthesis protein TonB
MTTMIHPEDLELFEYVEGELEEPRRLEVEIHLSSCGQCAEEVRLLETGKAALRAAPLLSLSEERRRLIFAGLPRQTERRPLVLSPKRLIAILTPVAAAALVAGVLVSTGGGDNERLAGPAVGEASQADQEGRAAAEPLQTAPAQDTGAPEEVATPDAAPPEEAAVPPEEAPAAQPPPAEEAAPADEPVEQPDPPAPAEDAAPREESGPGEKAAPAEQGAPAPSAAQSFDAAAPVARVAGPPAEVVRIRRKAGFEAKARDGAVEVTGADPDAVRRALSKRPAGEVAVLIS